MIPTPVAHYERIMAWVTISAPSLRSRRVSHFCSTHPLQRRVLRSPKSVFTMSTASQGSSADDYAQFSDMLDKGTSADALLPSDASDAASGESQIANTEQDKYAEFSELLGVEDGQHKSETGRKNIAQATPKKVVIDPGDYDVFDTLLLRTGGTGRKRMKGSKRFASPPVSAPPVKSQGTELRDDEAGGSLDTEKDPSEERRVAPSLSKEETAQAYAIMMEEFGAGIHGDTVAPPIESGKVDVEPEKPTLMMPPKRPGGSVRQVSTTDLSTTLTNSENSTGTKTVRAPPKPAVLKPKPMTPASILPNIKDSESATQKPISFYEGGEVPPAVILEEPVPELQPKPAIPGENIKDSESATQKPISLYEESGEVPPAETLEEPVPDLQPKPAIPGDSMTDASPETRTLSAVDEGANSREMLEGPPQASSVVNVDVKEKPAELRKPPTMPERVAFAEAFNTQIRKDKGMRKRKEHFAEEKAEILQDPKLVCDVE